MDRTLLCKWVACPNQGLSFPSPEELALHVEHDHVDPCASDDLFICQWEGCKVYNTPSYSFGWLQRHVKQKHTKERPNKCLMNGCNMSFNSVDALQKHMLRHFEHSPNLSPTKKTGNATALPGRPAASVGRPAAPKGRPAASKGRPATSKGRPATSKSRPAASKGRCAASEGRCAVSEGGCAATKDRPAASEGRPAATKDRPAASRSEGRPAASEGRPAISEGRCAMKEAVSRLSDPSIPVVRELEQVEVADREAPQDLPPKKHTSLKVKIPRKTLFSSTPYSNVPVAFNGAHFHSEMMDRRTMSIIRHTTNSLARHDLFSSSTPSITLTARIVGERRQRVAGDPEVLVRWTPHVLPDEWVHLGDFRSKKVVPFSELPSSQLSLLATKCFGFDKFCGRKSKRKP